jgi:hypothetical protein
MESEWGMTDRFFLRANIIKKHLRLPGSILILLIFLVPKTSSSHTCSANYKECIVMCKDDTDACMILV